ncbi:phosphodiester glycosidase family protein [Planctomycetota bacterium]|nr:phosphodiester glycosidase family protein [Planctomycetota bacterium]
MHKSTYLLLTAALLYPTTSSQAWETSNPFEGVTYSKLREKDVHPILGWHTSHLSVDVFEIDLDAQGISFTSTPDNLWGPGETDRQTTLNFMNQANAQIAFNTSYFYTEEGSGGNNNHGVLASNGKLISPWGTTFPFTIWPAINITEDNKVELVTEKGKNTFDYYNAVTGSATIVHNGNVIGDPESGIHPRTSIGYNEVDNKIIVMAVDGRSDQSYGVKLSHLGTLMKNFGATWAINLDGGGSTQLTMNNGNPHYVNTPSQKYRAVGANMGVYANIDNTYTEIANFEHNNLGNFYSKLTLSGSNHNLSGSSNYQIITDDSAVGHAAVKLELNKNNDDSGYLCRFLSGAGSSANNTKYTAEGFLGVWAKTTDANQQIAIAIDEGSDLEKSIKKDVIADGEWHYYEWNLNNNNDWLNFVGNGEVNNTTFSIDSILLYGENNSTIYLDNLTHDSDESLAIPEPASIAFLSLSSLALLCRNRK